MFVDFDATFHPTPEQIKGYEEFIKNMYKKGIEEKKCWTCENHISVMDNLPPFCIAFARCKLGMSVDETCLFYEAKGSIKND